MFLHKAPPCMFLISETYSIIVRKPKYVKVFSDNDGQQALQPPKVEVSKPVVRVFQTLTQYRERFYAVWVMAPISSW